MSRPAPADTLPPTARAIALILASTPTVQDAQPGVLHQLLEFSHRYTTQVLSDALVYAEHAGRSGKISMDDVVLGIQGRVGWEFGGRVPKEYLLTLATQTNSVPLPSVPEVFGVRLPPASECLTAVDFDLIPNQPPPTEKIYNEEIEEIEELESDEGDEEMEAAPIPAPSVGDVSMASPAQGPPVNAITPSDADIMGTPAGRHAEDASDEEDDGLFAGGDEDDGSNGDEAMEDVLATSQPDGQVNGLKRKLVEEEDYD